MSEGWPFIAYTDVEAVDLEEALARGREISSLSLDLAALISGFSLRVELDGVRRLTSDGKLGLLEFPPGAAIRVDEAPALECAAMATSLAAASLAAGDPAYAVVRNALRWYRQAIDDFEPMDRYLKLFTSLDMFVPSNVRGQKPRSFAAALRNA
jgi:hypothetical protein